MDHAFDRQAATAVRNFSFDPHHGHWCLFLATWPNFFLQIVTLETPTTTDTPKPTILRKSPKTPGPPKTPKTLKPLMKPLNP